MASIILRAGLILLVIGLCASCGKSNPSEVEGTLESALNFGGSLDEGAGGSSGDVAFGFPGKGSPLSFIPEALAATCTFPIQSCAAGAASTNYSGCSLPRGSTINSGTIAIAISGNGDCTIDNGETFTRTLTSLAVRGPLGRYQLTGDGTQTLARTGAATWTYTADVTRVLSRVNSGSTIRSFTTSFPTSLTITTGLSRASRQITAGTMRITNNTNGNVTDFTVLSTLTYSAGCYFPTGGALTVSQVTGSGMQGTTTVTFNSACGVPAMTDGPTIDLGGS